MSQSLSPLVSSAPSTLTAQQEQVLALLSAGSSLTDAAEAAGVHRNTIGNWRRSSGVFRDSLALAHFDKALYWREQAEQLAASALDAIKTILADPKAPAGVRLKAALAVLDKATTPPPPAPDRLPAEPTKPEIVHKNAQTTPAPRKTPPLAAQAVPLQKAGRNDACPCGSGKKFKRCCLAKSPRAGFAARGLTALFGSVLA